MPQYVRLGSALFGAALFFPPQLAPAADAISNPINHDENYSLTQGQAIKIAARHAKLPLVVYGESAGQQGTFVPSGYMGDTSSVQIKTIQESAPTEGAKPGQQALQVRYLGKDGDKRLPYGRDGWAGVYWQTPANNWAKVKGAGYNLSGAKRLTFWAKGEHGGEVIAAIKVGGLVGPYPDTDSATLTSLRLTPEWTKYTIDLDKKDLRHISGAFAFILRRQDDPRGAVFDLDEIKFEGDASTEVSASTTTATVAPGVVKSTTALAVPVLDHDVAITIPFPTAKYAFSDQGRDELDKIVAVALKYPGASIAVVGHTDNTGPADINHRLSYQRAKAVADYLEQHGVLRSRLTVRGEGQQHPVASNATEEGRFKNRRVNVRIRAQEGIK